MKNWNETKIWHSLSKIKSEYAQNARLFLSSKNCMKKIETILNKGSTSKKDFTLHDADHSFRVAERMWEIIPDRTKRILSEYELSLLLLSAYLHDIGMTPEFSKVKNHFEFLSTKNKKLLSVSEIEELQRWLDEEGEQIDIEKEIIDDLEKVEELTTYYCRHKHNDWSAEWIRNNFKENESGIYNNWINDLICICKSHHYGLEELKKETFNPVRIDGNVIHKRYLAMCLRLADVMELDPERAPEVLIKHRSIISGSLSHWLKEKFTSVYIDKNSVIVTATPTQAFIHKAIEDVANQIESETRLCNTLKGEMPLSNIYLSNDLKHEWVIDPTIFKSIKEAGNYEFIDGTFRPNSKKLLQLLAGTELYRNPLLAIRELIQNSLDAIKVQIGYRISNENNFSQQYIDSVKNSCFIELSVLKEGDSYWLCCKDNGVGMDKEIIKKCFLVGGAVKRRELLELERKCSKSGYNLELTGKFGIGVLSYFMIADKVIIETKKSLYSGNHDNSSWQFEINGLSDFGELRKSNLLNHGTEIKLRIKKEFATQIQNMNGIASLLEESLIRIPCNFTFKPLIGNVINFKLGWCKSITYIKNKLIERFHEECSPVVEVTEDFMTEEGKNFVETAIQRKSEIVKAFEASIDFLSVEGNLSGDNGYFRVHIPVFKNKEGDSFAFFFEKSFEGELFLQKINGGFLFYPEKTSIRIGWKGIGIENLQKFRGFPFNNCFVEVDLINSKSFQISVSRNDIIYKYPLQLIMNEITASIISVLTKNKKRFNSNTYSLFNHLKAECITPINKDLFWTYNNGYSEDRIKFERITFPLIFDLSTEIGSGDNEFFLKKRLHRLSYLRSNSNSSNFKKNKFKFDFAVYHNYYNYRISFIKTTALKKINHYDYIGNAASFPPEWGDILCFRGNDPSDIVLNDKSKYFKYFNRPDFEFVKVFFNEKQSINSDDGKKILASKSKCLCFLLYLISLNEKGRWDGLTKNNPEFLRKLWAKIFDNEAESIYFFHDGIADTDLTIISGTKWIILRKRKDILNYLPVPENNWRIEEKEN